MGDGPIVREGSPYRTGVHVEDRPESPYRKGEYSGNGGEEEGLQPIDLLKSGVLDKDHAVKPNRNPDYNPDGFDNPDNPRDVQDALEDTETTIRNAAEDAQDTAQEENLFLKAKVLLGLAISAGFLYLLKPVLEIFSGVAEG